MTNRMAQLLILQQRMLGKLACPFSGVGQCHRAVIAQKQRLADILFQPLNLSGKRRRADVHCPRSTAKMAAVRQMQKQF